MDPLHWLLLSIAVAALWAMAVSLNRRHVRALDGTGDAREGIVVFVEPVRWLSIVWGFVWFCRGLRRAECGHQVRLFRWCSVAGALLVIPDLVRHNRLRRKAKHLAERVDSLVAENPGCVVHLVGYSSGCFVTLEACRLVRSVEKLGQVVLLAGAVSPGYQWDGLDARLRRIHSFHSRLDWISGLGPLLFGSNDRRWGPGCGSVGFRNPPAVLQQRAWRPSDMLLGYFGDHFTIASPPFVIRHVAPIIKTGADEETS